METFPAVSRGIDLDDAAHLPSVLGRNAGGVNAHRLDVVRFNLGPGTWRTVIGQWNSVDHELRLVFRSSRMEDRIALIKPSRLRVHQVLQGTPRERGDSICNRLGADLVDGANAIRVDEGILVADLDRRIHTGNTQLDVELSWDGRTDLQRLRNRSEPFAFHFQPVHSEGQALGIEGTGLVGAKPLPKLIGLANQLNRTLQAESGRVGHSQAQFACLALGKERQRTQENDEEPLHGNGTDWPAH